MIKLLGEKLNKITKAGIITVIIAGLINSILVNIGIEGMVREVARLSIIAGIVILLFGLFYKRKNSK